MRSFDRYMALTYRMEITPDHYEGGYVVSFPDLPGCLTCADTLSEAMELAADAKREWLYASMEDGYPIPEPSACELSHSVVR